MVHKDYITRTIEDMVRILAKIVLRKDIPVFEADKPTEKDQTEFKCNKLISMAKQGKINEAENLLFETLDTEDLSDYERGLTFYSYLNDMGEEFLSLHDYSLEEVLQGIKDLTEEFHVTGIDLSMFKIE